MSLRESLKDEVIAHEAAIRKGLETFISTETFENWLRKRQADTWSMLPRDYSDLKFIFDGNLCMSWEPPNSFHTVETIKDISGSIPVIARKYSYWWDALIEHFKSKLIELDKIVAEAKASTTLYWKEEGPEIFCLIDKEDNITYATGFKATGVWKFQVLGYTLYANLLKDAMNNVVKMLKDQKKKLDKLDLENIKPLEVKLKRCPHCEGDRITIVNYVTSSQETPSNQVVCSLCKMSGPTKETEEEAKNSWNRLPR